MARQFHITSSPEAAWRFDGIYFAPRNRLFGLRDDDGILCTLPTLLASPHLYDVEEMTPESEAWHRERLCLAVSESTYRRIARLYVAMVGYDALAEGVPPRDALVILREYRAEMRGAA
ncbi:hypothetical protein GCM10011360_17620 [Primorskyibacter flagellatus]|uniref:Uncharacterized protein n=1 Tax=Primorskyibacter flagellatus TaxID=1387277 RepID=A0A917A609_9RHOB|nr:hypothetical protein [Primorskyibacter flagellatus]GGE30017.1 hypothetical protein GCM10011360_17620 [Primorskyibacter flagellatus]